MDPRFQSTCFDTYFSPMMFLQDKMPKVSGQGGFVKRRHTQPGPKRPTTALFIDLTALPVKILIIFKTVFGTPPTKNKRKRGSL